MLFVFVSARSFSVFLYVLFVLTCLYFVDRVRSVCLCVMFVFVVGVVAFFLLVYVFVCCCSFRCSFCCFGVLSSMMLFVCNLFAFFYSFLIWCVLMFILMYFHLFCFFSFAMFCIILIALCLYVVFVPAFLYCRLLTFDFL